MRTEVRENEVGEEQQRTVRRSGASEGPARGPWGLLVALRQNHSQLSEREVISYSQFKQRRALSYLIALSPNRKGHLTCGGKIYSPLLQHLRRHYSQS